MISKKILKYNKNVGILPLHNRIYYEEEKIGNVFYMRELNYLVKKLKNGEQKYFKEFYDHTKTSVFYLVKKTLGNHSLHAEDVMQEVYVTFLNKLPVIDDNKNYKAYLLSIAKLKSLDEIKKHARIDKSVEIADLPFSVTDNKLSDFPLMEYCKTKLTEEEFRLLELSVVYGFKQVEIAKMTKTSISTVNWRYNKLLLKIRKFYEEVYG